MIKEIQSKKVLTYHDDSFPTNWDLNPYRGCTIGCTYCFAQYTHKYLGNDDFFKDIYVKTNVCERLDEELGKRKQKDAQLKIGGTTDIYQHIENKRMMIPKIYEIIKKHRTPIFIQTKSTLILRDIEQISALSKITDVDIATSISTFDESIQKTIEPRASSTMERIEMLARLKEVCRTTTLGLMPIIPLLTDSDENIEMAFKMAKKYNFDFLVSSFLFLKGEVKPHFMTMMKQNFPTIYGDFNRLYSDNQLKNQYFERKIEFIEKLRNEYQLNRLFTQVKPHPKAIQLSLF